MMFKWSGESHLRLERLLRITGMILPLELVYINDDKELYDSLESQKEEIEAKLNLPLEWRRLDDKKASRIMHKIYGLNFDDHSNYGEIINEMIDKAVKFISVFKKYMK